MRTKGTIGPHAVNLEDDAFQKAVGEGRVYSVCNQAGVTSQAGLSATTPVLTLYNPLGSGVKGRIWYVGAVFTVVFAAVATVFVAVGTDVQTAAVSGTLTTTHRRTRLGSLLSHGNSVIPLLAATLPAAPVAVAILGAGLTSAVNLVPNTQPMGRWFNGALELMPGANLSVQTSAASGASGTWCEYIWEEIDL
jgi:hypothetical protein